MDLRNRTIDAARGIGIVLVVLGHAIGLPEWLFRVIYSCHMPLFFFLSGYLFNGKRGPLEVMRRNSRRLLNRTQSPPQSRSSRRFYLGIQPVSPNSSCNSGVRRIPYLDRILLSIARRSGF
ncbi:acyltransferase family protein [Caballeronia sp. LP003]|uniref:acyltransferase family protein n=1 Tax=Caballeronia sp. LP003 TaxID=3038551 RepID=UPI00285A2FCF|nr:acyltransferase family protein [Caballeronia sp. LP003]MDR5790074.1 acyltransferase family protein [Caballeronia sp. LP003]